MNSFGEMNQFPFDKLTEYFVRENNITLNTSYEIKKIKARELITANRIDLMAKWIYIEAKDKELDMQDATELYIRHIEAFSGGLFFEPGSKEKNSIEVFLKTFDNLIEDIRTNGFDENISLIPIGDNNVLLDGSHRCAVAAYYDLDITVIYFKGMTRDMGCDYFKKWLLYDSYLDRMVHEYCRIVKNIYCACIWPIADNEEKRKQAIKLISDRGKIIYVRNIKLTYTGITNFMIQVYGEQAWVGNYENSHAGIKGKVDCCFKRGRETVAVFFECDSLEKVIELKKEIRELFGIENHSIHISDNVTETKEMAALLLNMNSRHFLNYANPDKYSSTTKSLMALKNSIVAYGYNKDEFVIDTSSVLSIWGLREAKDLDYLYSYSGDDLFQLEKIDNHESQLKYYSISKMDLIYNPNNFFVYEGIKFVSLNRVYEMKKRRAEQKDLCDIKLIKKAYGWMKKDLKREQKEYQKNVHKRYIRVHGEISLKGIVYHMWIFFLKRTGLIKNTRWNV